MNANNAQYIHPSRDNRKAVYQDGEYRWLVETRGFEHYVYVIPMISGRVIVSELLFLESISTRINGDKIFWGCIEGMSPAVSATSLSLCPSLNRRMFVRLDSYLKTAAQ